MDIKINEELFKDLLKYHLSSEDKVYYSRCWTAMAGRVSWGAGIAL